MKLAGRRRQLGTRQDVVLKQPQEKRVVLGPQVVERRFIELELLEDRIVQPHFQLRGQAELDLEQVELGLQRGLELEQIQLGGLVA